jgi:type I restriction-modification system DNA methylase subunit
MPLFNTKTILKYISKNTEIPTIHLGIIAKWKDLIENRTIFNLNEVELHASFTNLIMTQLLGYKMVGQETGGYTVAREYKVARGAVDLALGQFIGDKKKDKVIAPFELKGAKTNLDSIMPGRHKTPVQQAFEYARDIKGAKWVLVSNYLEIRLYAVSETSLVYESFSLASLADPVEYNKFQLLLNEENFLGGKTEQVLLASEESDKDISVKLYHDYKQLRSTLITFMVSDNPEIAPLKLVSAAQKLLDRILFISFAEDKGLIPDNCIRRAFEHSDPYNPKPIYENFKGLFKGVDKGNTPLNIPAYNGGLFAPDTFLDSLNVSDELCEGFKLLSDYDFDSDVSVNVLGRIFEQSISDLEKIIESVSAGEIPKAFTEKKNSVSGKRKTAGIVYTPEAITRFMVDNTLGKHIREKFEVLFQQFGSYGPKGEIKWGRKKKNELNFWLLWQEELKNTKIVDPAVGSGAFIVASFAYLYPEYERVNERIIEITGQATFLDLNKEILNNNLYGVDINEESIEITKLSLWLVTAEIGKPLQTLDNNFMNGNSLGFELRTPDSAFIWKEAFHSIFQQGGFDVVLGNPPYVRQELLGDIKPWLASNMNVYHGVIDLYAYFFEVGIKLLKVGGRLAYISSNTFFKTNAGRSLRKYLTDNARIEDIIDFGDLQVFEGVTTYPAILSFVKLPVEQEHIISICKVQDAIPENLGQYVSQMSQPLKQSSLLESGWQLESQDVIDLKEKLFKSEETIKDTIGSPFRGVLTGYNDAFIIDTETRKKLILADAKSSEIIKPFYEGRDFKKWHAQPRGIFIIMTRRGTDIDNYPAIKEYLEQYRERLEPKPKDWTGKKWGGRKAGPYKWFEIQDTVAYYKSFEKKKIHYAHFCSEPLFHYNKNGAYSNDKSYILPTDDQFVCGLLNSKVYWFLMRSVCPFVRGGFYELRAQYIETLPVPARPENETISVLASEIQSLVEQRFMIERRFTNRLIDLCPSDVLFNINNALSKWWKLDFAGVIKEIKKSFKGEIRLADRDDWEDYFNQCKEERARLDLTARQKEDQLNEEVYSLFSLTEDEKQIVIAK